MTWNTNTAMLAQLETVSAATAWTSLFEHFEPPLKRQAQRSGPRADALLTFGELDAEEVVTRPGLPRAKIYDARHRVSRRLRELAREHEDA